MSYRSAFTGLVAVLLAVLFLAGCAKKQPEHNECPLENSRLRYTTEVDTSGREDHPVLFYYRSDGKLERRVGQTSSSFWAAVYTHFDDFHFRRENISNGELRTIAEVYLTAERRLQYVAAVSVPNYGDTTKTWYYYDPSGSIAALVSGHSLSTSRSRDSTVYRWSGGDIERSERYYNDNGGSGSQDFRLVETTQYHYDLGHSGHQYVYVPEVTEFVSAHHLTWVYTDHWCTGYDRVATGSVDTEHFEWYGTFNEAGHLTRVLRRYYDSTRKKWYSNGTAYGYDCL